LGHGRGDSSCSTNRLNGDFCILGLVFDSLDGKWVYFLVFGEEYVIEIVGSVECKLFFLDLFFI
jgi:hypothetical protein